MIESQRLHSKNTLTSLIESCKNIVELKQIHAHIIKSPHLSISHFSFLISRILFFLCTVSKSSLSLNYATKIFRHFPNPNVFMYNSVIRGYATKSEDPCCLYLYREMLRSGLTPDCITFPFVLKDCTKRSDGLMGRSLQGHILKFGCENDVYVGNCLISVYSESGVLMDARKVFDGMLNRDVVSWNSIIIGCLRGGELDEALDLFREMKIEKNVVTWNSLITGFVQGGRRKEALGFFHEMQVLVDSKDVVRPDKITIATVLSACASLGALDHGRWVHSYLKRSGMECDVVIGTALVDMYGKCGYVDRAFEVFNGMPKKDVMAWTAMISVLALHGYGNEAFELFFEMEDVGIRPNAITFVGLLSACSHSGEVEKGHWCFDIMRRVYHIEPQRQHYACMVDMLSRAGLFVEAEELIRIMPMDPDAFVWGALLGGCQMHGNVDLGEKVARCLINLDPQNHAFYINLCFVYAKAARFDDVRRIRALMEEKEIKKAVAGCSMIEVDGVVYEFSVKRSAESVAEAVKCILTLLSHEMKIEKNYYE